jgi:hypothetical protein
MTHRGRTGLRFIGQADPDCIPRTIGRTLYKNATTGYTKHL